MVGMMSKRILISRTVEDAMESGQLHVSFSDVIQAIAAMIAFVALVYTADDSCRRLWHSRV
jgi:urease gamma subunit